MPIEDTDSDISFLMEHQGAIDAAHSHFEEGVEELLAGLSLPLSNSLDVPPEQVGAKSQELLERLVQLRQEREEAIDAIDQTMEAYIDRFPKEEQDEVRAKMQVLGMFF